MGLKKAKYVRKTRRLRVFRHLIGFNNDRVKQTRERSNCKFALIVVGRPAAVELLFIIT